MLAVASSTDDDLIDQRQKRWLDFFIFVRVLTPYVTLQTNTSSTQTAADRTCEIRTRLPRNHVGWTSRFLSTSPSLSPGSLISLEILNSIMNNSSPPWFLCCLHFPVCQIYVTVVKTALKAVLVAEILATGRMLTRLSSPYRTHLGSRESSTRNTWPDHLSWDFISIASRLVICARCRTPSFVILSCHLMRSMVWRWRSEKL